MLLTLAVLQPIIGVVPEQKSCTRNQKQKNIEKLHDKNKHYSQVLVFY